MRCPKDRVVLIVGKGGLYCWKCDYVIKTKDLRVGNSFYKKRKDSASDVNDEGGKDGNK